MTPDFNAVSPIKAVARIKAPLLLCMARRMSGRFSAIVGYGVKDGGRGQGGNSAPAQGRSQFFA
jgi:hypothetical protein